MDLKLFKMLCKDSKQHHVMFHELYLVSLLLCIAQNVRFEIPYKVLYFETPFLIIFKYYAWVSCGQFEKSQRLGCNKPVQLTSRIHAHVICFCLFTFFLISKRIISFRTSNQPPSGVNSKYETNIFSFLVALQLKIKGK